MFASIFHRSHRKASLPLPLVGQHLKQSSNRKACLVHLKQASDIVPWKCWGSPTSPNFANTFSCAEKNGHLKALKWFAKICRCNWKKLNLFCAEWWWKRRQFSWITRKVFLVKQSFLNSGMNTHTTYILRKANVLTTVKTVKLLLFFKPLCLFLPLNE